MVDQVFNIYTAKGYAGDLVDSSPRTSRSATLLSGTVGFGVALQPSGTGDGCAIGSAEVGATSLTNVWGISMREYNHEAGSRPTDGTDFLYRALETVSVLKEGYIYLEVGGATAITRDADFHVDEATGIFHKDAIAAGNSTCMNVYAVEPGSPGDVVKARIDIRRTSTA